MCPVPPAARQERVKTAVGSFERKRTGKVNWFVFHHYIFLKSKLVRIVKVTWFVLQPKPNPKKNFMKSKKLQGVGGYPTYVNRFHRTNICRISKFVSLKPPNLASFLAPGGCNFFLLFKFFPL